MLIDLSKASWRLAGWRPFSWNLRPKPEGGTVHWPEIGPIDAVVPGAVQTSLLRANWIEDWNVGLNSIKCEFVEHRHWEFFTELAPIAPETPVRLECEGLDHSGWIVVGKEIVATFEGSLVRHSFDLTKHLADGEPKRLGIIFDEPPREQGQVGYTSRSKDFKPRFSYSWDWTVRMVPVGIWDRIALRLGEVSAEFVKARTELSEDLKQGTVQVVVDVKDANITRAKVTLANGKTTKSESYPVRVGENALILEIASPELWYANGIGEQALYRLTVQVEGGGKEVPVFEGDVGFKRVRWLPCEGAAADARPWICEVNGKAIFMQGVNWTPISTDYATVTREEYAKRIDLYKQMGCNVLRVWGGAFLEKEEFYELCDRAGLMLWQEFPLSSSGVENYAPDDAGAIAKLRTIATDYIRRRGHHACKLLWCGGNELCGEKQGRSTTPLDLSHPALAAMKEIVDREDPGTRFIPTSPGGPTFGADAKEYGKGIHHHVHGPWNMHGPMEQWIEYWTKDDSKLRSEVGMPSASPLDIIQKYRGEYAAWPVNISDPWWAHASSWWLQQGRYTDELAGLSPEEGLAKFVELSQKLQADALAIAAKCSKDRFPGCAGFIIWMGHDCFPCGANTSIVDFWGRAKPAYWAVREVFKNAGNSGS